MEVVVANRGREEERLRRRPVFPAFMAVNGSMWARESIKRRVGPASDFAFPRIGQT